MRFIRKNGKIIPISEPGDKKLAKRNSKGGYGKTAAIAGAGLVSVAMASPLFQAMKFPKAARAATGFGVGLGLAAITRPLVKGTKVFNETAVKTKDVKKANQEATKEYIKHEGARFSGTLAGAAIAVKGFKPAFRGLYKAAKAVKPYTAEFSELRKFRKAIPVTADVKVTSLSRKYK